MKTCTVLKFYENDRTEMCGNPAVKMWGTDCYFCPDCIAKLKSENSVYYHLLRDLPKERKCEACDFEDDHAVVTLDTNDAVFTLCLNCLVRLVNFSLSRKAALKLIALHGDKTFYLHDDFYDENGHALQPMDDD